METMDPFERTDQSPRGATGPGGTPEPVSALNAAWTPPAVETEPGSADAISEMLQCMCFRVGALGLLFPANAAREVIAPPPVSRVPNTVSWLRGLANVRGELVPVVDMAGALGVARQAGVPAYLMIFGHGETAIGLVIDGLPRLFNVSVSQRLPDRPETPVLLDDSVIAAYEHAGRIWLDIDLDALFDTFARRIALV